MSADNDPHKLRPRNPSDTPTPERTPPSSPKKENSPPLAAGGAANAPSTASQTIPKRKLSFNTSSSGSDDSGTGSGSTTGSNSTMGSTLLPHGTAPLGEQPNRTLNRRDTPPASFSHVSSREDLHESSNSEKPFDVNLFLSKRNTASKFFYSAWTPTKKFFKGVAKKSQNYCGYDLMMHFFDGVDGGIYTPYRDVIVFTNINDGYNPVFLTPHGVIDADIGIGAAGGLLVGGIYTVAKCYQQDYFDESANPKYIFEKINQKQAEYHQPLLTSEDFQTEYLKSLQHVMSEHYEIKKTEELPPHLWKLNINNYESIHTADKNTLTLFAPKLTTERKVESFKINYVDENNQSHDIKFNRTWNSEKNCWDNENHKEIYDLYAQYLKIDELDPFSDDEQERKNCEKLIGDFWNESYYQNIDFKNRYEKLQDAEKKQVINELRRRKKFEMLDELEKKLKLEINRMIDYHANLREQFIDLLRKDMTLGIPIDYAILHLIPNFDPAQVDGNYRNRYVWCNTQNKLYYVDANQQCTEIKIIDKELLKRQIKDLTKEEIELGKIPEAISLKQEVFETLVTKNGGHKRIKKNIKFKILHDNKIQIIEEGQDVGQIIDASKFPEILSFIKEHSIQDITRFSKEGDEISLLKPFEKEQENNTFTLKYKLPDGKTAYYQATPKPKPNKPAADPTLKQKTPWYETNGYKTAKNTFASIAGVYFTVNDITMAFWIFWFPIFIVSFITAGAVTGGAAWWLLGMSFCPLLIKAIKTLVTRATEFKSPEQIAHENYIKQQNKEIHRKAGKHFFINQLHKQKAAYHGLTSNSTTEIKVRLKANGLDLDKPTSQPDTSLTKYDHLLKIQPDLVVADAFRGFNTGFLSSQFMVWVLMTFLTALKTTFAPHFGTLALAAMTGPTGIIVITSISLVIAAIFIVKHVCDSIEKQQRELAQKNQLIELKTPEEQAALREEQQEQQAYQNKLQKLQLIEIENKKMKDSISALGLSPISMPDAKNDRAYRRLSEQSATFGTRVKQFFNRAFIVILRLGTGILDIRLLCLAGCMVPVLIGLGASAALPLLPFVLLACATAVFITAMAIHKYRQDSIRAAELRLVNDIDIRTDSALYENDLLFQQKEALTKDKSSDEINSIFHNFSVKIRNIINQRTLNDKPIERGLNKMEYLLSNINSQIKYKNALTQLLALQKIAKDRLARNPSGKGRDPEIHKLYLELAETNFYLAENKIKNGIDLGVTNIPAASITTTNKIFNILKKIVGKENRFAWRESEFSNNSACPKELKEIRHIVERIDEGSDANIIKQTLHELSIFGKNKYSRKRGLSGAPMNRFCGILQSINENNHEITLKNLQNFQSQLRTEVPKRFSKAA